MVGRRLGRRLGRRRGWLWRLLWLRLRRLGRRLGLVGFRTDKRQKVKNTPHFYFGFTLFKVCKNIIQPGFGFTFNTSIIKNYFCFVCGHRQLAEVQPRLESKHQLLH
jgi:hypothetical protein